MSKPTEWKLENYFYKDHLDPSLMRDVETYQAGIALFAISYKGRIASLSDRDFLMYLSEFEKATAAAEKVSMYLGLLMSLDLQNQELQKLAQRLEKMGSTCQQAVAFVDEEYKAMGYDKLMALSQNPLFARYKNYIVNQADSLKYALSEAQETLLIKSAQASSENMFEELVSAFEFPLKGEMLTMDQVRASRESHIREERYAAYKSISSVFSEKKNQIVLGNLYSLVCKGNVFNMEIRSIPTVMSSMNFSEEVSDEAVDALIAAVTKAYPLYHEFLAEKKRLLGLDDFSIVDVFAPVSEVASEDIPFEKGWAMFMDTIKAVDPVQYAFSQEMLDEARVSVYPYAGKTSGAYANYGPSTKEFMLLNWTGKDRDVATLAHEMGHCFHGRLAKKQSALVYDTPLTLAETASIFNETLMFESMIASVGEDQRKAMVARRLDDIFGTIFRQIFYTRFERSCHESFARNEPMTYDDYNALWLKEMALLYGPNVAIDPELAKSSWSSISHIYHTPFYCYTYAFGNLISLNLVQQYKQAQDKSEFMTKYHEFLSAGGSERPEDLLLRIFGIKMDERFYEVGLQSIRDLMDMLKTPAHGQEVA